MGECEHEWVIYAETGRIYFGKHAASEAKVKCQKGECREKMSLVDAKARLNEHAALKREAEKVTLLEMALRVAHLPLPPYDVLAQEQEK